MKTNYVIEIHGTSSFVSVELQPSKEVKNLHSFIVGNVAHRVIKLAGLKSVKLFKKSEDLKVRFIANGVVLNTGTLSAQLHVNLKTGKSQIESGKFKENLSDVVEAGLLLADSRDYSD